MFWWIVLAIVVTFGVAFLLRVTPISTLMGMLLAMPFGFLLGDKENRGARTGTFANLFCSFVSCFAGLVLGGLILSHHATVGLYWILCAPVVGIFLIVGLATASDPVPQEMMNKGYMEAWPNLIGCAGAVVACFYLVRPWFKT